MSRTLDLQLRILAFMAGFVSLAFEITFARMLAPAFGSSIFVWTNVIGVVLIGMALGAYVGGRMADRWPSPLPLAAVTAATAAYLFLLPSVAAPLLRLASRALTEQSASIFLASLLATLALAFIPSATLGIATPYVIRLRAVSVAKVGRDAGGVSALATVGSILGTFAPTLWMIPVLGVRVTVFVLASALIFVSVPLLGRRALALVLLPVLAWQLPYAVGATEHTIAMRESAYQFIAVDEFSGGLRTLRMNEGQAIHSILVPWQLRTQTIYDLFLLLPTMHGGEFHTMANVGLAGGTVAHLFQQVYPDVAVTGIELDPVVIELGREYFTLDEPNLTILNQDGRIALATRPHRYDAIVVDAYRQPYIPFHLTTREYFTLCRDRLEEGGIFAMNVATIRRDDPVLTSILNTVAAVFPHVWVYTVPDAANFLVFASDDALLMERLAARMVPLEIVDLQEAMLATAERVEFDPAIQVLTDDKAPVELYTDIMLFRAASGGEIQGFPRREG